MKRALLRVCVAVIVAFPCVAAALDQLPAFFMTEAQLPWVVDFETTVPLLDGTLSGWDGPANLSVMYVTDRMSRSGDRALELKYLPGTNGASFMYKQFVGLDHLYLRWYQRWSPGFIWEPSSTKMVIFRPRGGYPQFYPEVLWANGQLAIQAQVIAEANWDSRNFYQNIGDPVVFQSERWYCIEVFVKLNTPGLANGELAAWIDGTLKLHYPGREFRGSGPLDPAPSTARIESVGMSGHYGGLTPVPQEQYSWIDDVAFSTTRIGFHLFSEDFEAAPASAPGVNHWDGPANPSIMYVTGEAANTGAQSLELKYVPGSNGASYMYRTFAAQDEVYVRWYQKWAPGFVFDPWATGLAGLRPFRGYPHFYPFLIGAAGRLAIQAQVLADRAWDSENFFQNLGDPVDFEPGRWYCIEVGVKLNTPGAADGTLSAWIDGTRKIFYEGRRFRGAQPSDPSPSTAQLQALLISGLYGGYGPVPQLQHAWQDDFVAATRPIGCGSSPLLPPVIVP